MEMYEVVIEDSTYYCGKKEKDFLVRVFKDKVKGVHTIQLPVLSGSGILGSDE